MKPKQYFCIFEYWREGQPKDFFFLYPKLAVPLAQDHFLIPLFRLKISNSAPPVGLLFPVSSRPQTLPPTVINIQQLPLTSSKKTFFPPSSSPSTKKSKACTRSHANPLPSPPIKNPNSSLQPESLSFSKTPPFFCLDFLSSHRPNSRTPPAEFVFSSSQPGEAKREAALPCEPAHLLSPTKQREEQRSPANQPLIFLLLPHLAELQLL